MTQREWPHSLESEQNVIGAVLLHPRSLSEVATRLPTDGDFHHPAHGAVYAAILELDRLGRPIDTATVEQQLTSSSTLDRLRSVGGVRYLVDLQSNVISVENVAYHAEVIAKKAERRRRIKLASEIAARGFGDSDDAAYLAESDRLLLELAMASRSSTEPRPMKQVLNEYVKMLEHADKLRREGKTVTGVTSGLEKLDALTAGFQPKDLVVVAGRPAMGKSGLVGCVVRAAAQTQGVHALVFSLEMAAKYYVGRLIAAQGHFDGDRLRRALLEPAEWGRMLKVQGELAPLPVWWEDASGLTFTQIRAASRRWRMTRAKDQQAVVVIDFAQLVDPSDVKKGANREQEVAFVSRGAKQLAKELDLPVLLVASLNRALEGRPDKRPQLSDLRESGQIESDADLAMFVYRDEVYHHGCEEACERCDENKGKAELIIGKQRNGPTGTAEVAFVEKSASFENLSTREYVQ